MCQDLHLIHLPLAFLEPFLGHHYLSSDISDIVVCHQPVCILMYLYSLPTLVFRDT